jgi:hypothetical protein
MKKLLMGTVILSSFAIALSLVQISCSKTNAQSTNSNLTQLSKIVYSRQNIISSDMQIWIANYDGTNPAQIPISLPANVTITGDAAVSSVKLSPDGQTLFFLAYDNTTTVSSIYSCNINGSNVQLVIPHNNTDVVRIGGAY